MVKLAKDLYGNIIQALAPGASTQVAIGAGSQRVALPTDSQVIRIGSNNKCFIKLGDSSVVATGTDIIFPAGSEVFRVPVDATHLAVIQDGAVTGSVSITSME